MRGSLLDADHPANGVLFARRSTNGASSPHAVYDPQLPGAQRSQPLARRPDQAVPRSGHRHTTGPQNARAKNHAQLADPAIYSPSRPLRTVCRVLSPIARADPVTKPVLSMKRMRSSLSHRARTLLGFRLNGRWFSRYRSA